MAQLLKNIFFQQEFFQKLNDVIMQEYPEFKGAEFLEKLYDQTWEEKELKERMRHATHTLKKFLPLCYEQALQIVLAVAPKFSGFNGMIFPDFVEVYGQDYVQLSLEALGELTKYSSSEFAIRPFLQMNLQNVMKKMFFWADSKNEHVRRFASEGCRPRLPWAMALPQLKKDPRLISPILEKLKADKSLYVRKSVANNLNDISKDHPELVLEFAKKWYGKNKYTDWIIQHGLRTLLKNGNTTALQLFGFANPEKVCMQDFSLQNQEVNIGESLQFSFAITLSESQKLRLEYFIYFQKANGSLARKIFRIAQAEYASGTRSFQKKHEFRDMTTRKHYEGKHKISVVINGQEREEREFLLRF